MSKILILYSYRDYPDSAKNFRYFIQNTSHLLGDQIKLLVAYNQKNLISDLHSYGTIEFIQTTGKIDLSDYRSLLRSINISEYSYFIFLNSSCLGPILPVFIKDNWIDLVINYLDKKTKLVSPIVEVPPDSFGLECLPIHKFIKEEDKNIPFAHSYFFATDKTGLKLLSRYDIFPDKDADKDEAILHFERLLSSAILNEGYEIKSFMKIHQGISWLDKKNWNPKMWTLTDQTCPEIPGNYLGADLDPYEMLFFKNIRHPHNHRDQKISGIAEHNQQYISNIIDKK